MIIRILKILVVISFLSITVDTGHVGGPFAAFLVLGFLSDIWTVAMSTLYLTVLILFVLSGFKNFKKKDIYLFIGGGVILLIPIVMHISFLLKERKNSGDNLFYITTTIFLIMYGITLFQINKLQRKSE